MTLEQLSAAGTALGVTGLLIAALFGLYKEWWVPGWVWRAKVKEADEWKVMALAGLRTAADVSESAKSHTMLTPEEADQALRIVREAGKSK